ncbi:unannotated protein [freshwater metagenome]|uniref:Unannotated protein n=1 Tax=freshwater metagenome TaxID=449393 RepID=A0A6J7A7L3_9ZZZZ
MAHVVTLDTQWSYWQRQVLLKVIESFGPAVVIGCPLESMPLKGVHCILRHCFCKLTLGATLRNANLNPAATLRCQPFLIHGRVLGNGRHQHRLWVSNGRGIAINLLQHCRHGLSRIQVHHFVQNEAESAHHSPPPHKKYLRSSLEIILMNPDDVDIFGGVANHLLSLNCSPHSSETITGTRSLLKLHRSGSSSHFGFQALQYRLNITL